MENQHQVVTLNEDIYSNFYTGKGKTLYGKKDETVTVIYKNLPALIVESKAGVRFAVNEGRVRFEF